jgi:hypothetical protein
MYIVKGYEWATHQPLIRLAMNYNPRFILELGGGIYSTPIFLAYDTEFRCIDNDVEWAEYLSENYGIDVEVHKCSAGETHYDELTERQKAEIAEYYRHLIIPGNRPNLLFVDQVASCRLISIQELKSRFDIIVYHDHDAAGFWTSSFQILDRSGFNSYIVKTPGTGACIMIRKELDKGFERNNEVMIDYMNDFLSKWDECKTMTFDEYNPGK